MSEKNNQNSNDNGGQDSKPKPKPPSSRYVKGSKIIPPKNKKSKK